jgi:hypothetical protein
MQLVLPNIEIAAEERAIATQQYNPMLRLPAFASQMCLMQAARSYEVDWVAQQVRVGGEDIDIPAFAHDIEASSPAPQSCTIVLSCAGCASQGSAPPSA